MCVVKIVDINKEYDNFYLQPRIFFLMYRNFKCEWTNEILLC